MSCVMFSGAILQELVASRLRLLDSIAKTHSGSRRQSWLGVATLSDWAIRQAVPAHEVQARCRRYAVLGFSCAPLLHLSNGRIVMMAVSQLMHEFAIYFEAEGKPNVRRGFLPGPAWHSSPRTSPLTRSIVRHVLVRSDFMRATSSPTSAATTSPRPGCRRKVL